MFNIVLVQPEIPPNTGNIIRLAANTGCNLHLIEPLGFSMEDRQLQRAGLDYHECANVVRYASWFNFSQATKALQERCFALSSKATVNINQICWQAGDWIFFGSETAGLPDAIRNEFSSEQIIRLPMRPGQRSLNLSNAVAVCVYEAWRQTGYHGGL